MAAVLAWLTVPASAQTVVFSDAFDLPDGLITNEYAYWNPELPDAVLSANWEMTSGSLFADGGKGWTGIPDDATPNATSSDGTNSAVFRLTSRRNDFKDVLISFSMLNQGLSATPTTPAVSWDGLHIFLRYQSEVSLYYASINRRDNKVVIKKKVPGGSSNGGTYHDLSGYAPYTVPYGSWQSVRASIQNAPDGSVAIKLYSGSTLLVSATDNGTVGGAPITAAGKVGLRADNANLKFEDFAVAALNPSGDSTPPTVSLTAPAPGDSLSGSATLSAAASDDVGVAGVRFKIDGSDLGTEDASAPYAIAWNTLGVPNGPHAVTAVARDAAGNTSVSAAVSVTVANDLTPPVLSSVSSSSITSSGAIISWNSDEPSDTQVEYGPTASYGHVTVLSPSLLAGHSAALSGLSPGTLHHYRARSRDASGNLAVSPDFAFTTSPSSSDTRPPVVSIISPSDGSTAKRGITCNLGGSDDVSVARAELWVDGSRVASKTFSPPVPSFNAILNWPTPTNGQHSVQAKAYDSSGNVGLSPAITLKVVRAAMSVSLLEGDSGAEPVSPYDAAEPATRPRALLLSLRRGTSQTLVFSPEVQEASILDMRGRVLARRTRQGGDILLPLQTAADRRLGMESGLWLIHMKDGEGGASVKPLVVVK